MNSGFLSPCEPPSRGPHRQLVGPLLEKKGVPAENTTGGLKNWRDWSVDVNVDI